MTDAHLVDIEEVQVRSLSERNQPSRRQLAADLWQLVDEAGVEFIVATGDMTDKVCLIRSLQGKSMRP